MRSHSPTPNRHILRGEPSDEYQSRGFLVRELERIIRYQERVFRSINISLDDTDRVIEIIKAEVQDLDEDVQQLIEQSRSSVIANLKAKQSDFMLLQLQRKNIKLVARDEQRQMEMQTLKVENSSLTALVQQLRAQIAAKRGQETDLSTIMERSRLTEVSQCRSGHLERIKQLNEQVVSLQAELKQQIDLAPMIDRLKFEKYQLEMQLQQQKKIAEDMERSYHELLSQSSQTEVALHKQIRNIKSSSQVTTKTHRAVLKEVSQQLKDLAFCINNKTPFSFQSQDSAAQIKQLKELHITKMKNDKQKTEENQQTLLSQVEELKRQLKERKISQSSTHSSNANGSLSKSQQSANDSMSTRAEFLSKEVSRKQQTINELERMMKEEAENHRATVLRLNQDLSAAVMDAKKGQIRETSLQQELMSLDEISKAQLSASEKELSFVRAKHQEMQRNIAEQLKKAEATNSSLKAKLREAEKKLAEQVLKGNKMKSRITELQQEKVAASSQASRQYEELHTKHQELTINHKVLQKMNMLEISGQANHDEAKQILTKELEKISRQALDLKAENSNFTHKIDAEKMLNSHLIHQVQTLQSEKLEVCREKDSLQTLLEQTETCHKSTIQLKNQEYEALQRHVAELDNQIRHLEQSKKALALKSRRKSSSGDPTSSRGALEVDDGDESLLVSLSLTRPPRLLSCKSSDEVFDSLLLSPRESEFGRKMTSNKQKINCSKNGSKAEIGIGTYSIKFAAVGTQYEQITSNVKNSTLCQSSKVLSHDLPGSLITEDNFDICQQGHSVNIGLTEIKLQLREFFTKIRSDVYEILTTGDLPIQEESHAIPINLQEDYVEFLENIKARTDDMQLEANLSFIGVNPGEETRSQQSIGELLNQIGENQSRPSCELVDQLAFTKKQIDQLLHEKANQQSTIHQLTLDKEEIEDEAENRFMAQCEAYRREIKQQKKAADMLEMNNQSLKNLFKNSLDLLVAEGDNYEDLKDSLDLFVSVSRLNAKERSKIENVLAKYRIRNNIVQ